MLKRLLALLGVSLLLQKGIGQGTAYSDSLQQASEKSIASFYSSSLGKESGLYNGQEYARYNPSFVGHAYFKINNWQNSSVTYDGITYFNVPALYDLVKDQLIIRHFNDQADIQLIKEKVAGFVMDGHTFVSMNRDSLGNSSLQPGFYDQLYTGSLLVLARRTKEIKEYFVAQQIETRIEEKANYYIKRDSVYYSIKNSASLFSVLKDKKKGVQQYLRRSKIKFKKDPENAIVKATAYYDSLKK